MKSTILVAIGLLISILPNHLFAQSLCSMVDKVAAMASKETPIYLDKSTYLNSVMGIKHNCSMKYRYITDDNMYQVTPEVIRMLTKYRREYWTTNPQLQDLKRELKSIEEEYTSKNTGKYLFTVKIK